MRGMKKPKAHSPACRSRRTEQSCNCEANLVERIVKVHCECGNRWEELGFRDHAVADCACAFPGDDEEAPDDSVDWRSREHTYNVDRL